MGFYNDFILPRLCDLAMRNKEFVPIRERVIGAAEGTVLEIGVGSGMNLPFYRPPVREVLALEPAARLVTMARSASHATGMPVNFLEASAEAIPLRRWQDRLTPVWRRIGGGCHLNRPIRSMIEGAGFRIDRIETGYIPGPKPMSFMYEGSAWPG
jgi:hypothetical protein